MLGTVTLKIDATMVHYTFCSKPLKPPVFKCDGGHLVSGSCTSELPLCVKCEEPGVFSPDSSMNAVISAVTIQCTHTGYGIVVAFHEIHDHEIACAHAPCACTEPNCSFASPPAALVVHLAESHVIPVHRVQYGRSKVLQELVPLPGSPCWRLIVEEVDGAVFILIIGAVGLLTVVSCVCVRSAACFWPLYRVWMWANVALTSSLPDCRNRTDTAKVEFHPPSSVKPAEVTVEKLTSFLGAPPRYLVSVGSSKDMRFYFRIDKHNIS